jgi:histidinol dehydrogenase
MILKIFIGYLFFAPGRPNGTKVDCIMGSGQVFVACDKKFVALKREIR